MAVTKTAFAQLALIGLKVPNFFSRAFFLLEIIAQNFTRAISFEMNRAKAAQKISDNDDVLIEQRRLNKKTV